MRVIVTGGARYIGGQTVLKLLDQEDCHRLSFIHAFL